MSKSRGKRTVKRILLAFAVFGMSIGVVFALLLCVNAAEAPDAMKKLLLPDIQKTLLYWPMLTLTGLSVGCAWKTGVFHLAVPGQYALGGLAALFGASLLDLPGWVCLILSGLGGAVGGVIVNAVKKRSRTEEVLLAVFFDFVVLHLAQGLIEDGLLDAVINKTLPAIAFKNGFSIPLGLPLALALCLALWIALRFTVIGYEVKAVASNREAAKRAGMPVERNRKWLLVLSGVFSGLAGGLLLLSGMTDGTPVNASVQMGLAGLPIALLSFGYPLGTAAAAFAFGGILAGSEMLIDFPQETSYILIALTLLGCAVLSRKNTKK